MSLDILSPIVHSSKFKEILDELNQTWQLEQERRHRFWAEVDENIKSEWIDGEIVYHSPVYGRHWAASTNILTELLPFVKKSGLGKVGVEKVMIRLTRNDYEPDICFWQKSVAQTFKSKQSTFPPPDFIIEILSDSTEMRDRGIKMEDYASHNVAEYWIVDTEEKTVEQYILVNGVYKLRLKVSAGLIHSNAIPGFIIKAEDIFLDSL